MGLLKLTLGGPGIGGERATLRQWSTLVVCLPMRLLLARGP